VGAHQYDAGTWNIGHDNSKYTPPPFTKSEAGGKEIWMTEWGAESFDKWSDMEQALVLGQLVHQDFTISHINAYIYWWKPALMTRSGSPSKKLYALGQFSRFIRPGWKMVPVSQPSPLPLVYTSTYIDPSGGRMTVVMVNRSVTNRTLEITPLSGSLGKGSTVRTSATENMVPVSTFNGGPSCPITVPGSSIVTLSVALNP
jgi:O-glycosyl hydrolase